MMQRSRRSKEDLIRSFIPLYGVPETAFRFSRTDLHRINSSYVGYCGFRTLINNCASFCNRSNLIFGRRIRITIKTAIISAVTGFMIIEVGLSADSAGSVQELVQMQNRIRADRLHAPEIVADAFQA